MWRITRLTGALSALAIVASCGGGANTLPPPPALSIVNASLPAGFVMFAYSQTVQSSGGVGPFTWAISSGNLPHNLAIGNSSTSSVTISGTPDIVQAAATFTIRVTDAKSQSTTKSFSISISNVASAQLQEVPGQVPADTIEIRGVGITDSLGAQYSPQGGYGPDRQWFQAQSSGLLQGTITVYAEDGITPLAAGSVNLSAGKAYQLVLGGG